MHLDRGEPGKGLGRAGYNILYWSNCNNVPLCFELLVHSISIHCWADDLVSTLARDVGCRYVPPLFLSTDENQRFGTNQMFWKR